MSWQHLNQPWGWIGVILLSLSLSKAGIVSHAVTSVSITWMGIEVT